MSRVSGILDSPEVDRLVLLVEESARAANKENPRFIEPAQGTLDRAKSARHHIVFGRRGSGKTSLLSKAASDLTVERRPIAFIDLETFKGHSYPDVLISVLIKTLEEFKIWIETAAIIPASKTSFWKKLFGSNPKCPPLNKAQAIEIAKELEEKIDLLYRQLNTEDAKKILSTTELQQEIDENADLNAGIQHSGINIGATIGNSEKLTHRSSAIEESRVHKIDFLHRNALLFQAIFKKISIFSSGNSYLFLDDLYHIKKSDQPHLIDYFHRLAKGNRLYLKIGTIKHRTEWYRHSEQPIGVKLGDDADEIDLDLTLEKYELAKKFLYSILSNIAREANIASINQLIVDTARDRLVVASGGVTRDFLALFRRSVLTARERIERHSKDPGSTQKINAEDVNISAGEHDTAKREELKRDAMEERITIENAFERVKQFCIEITKTNCFLVEKDKKDPAHLLIEELVDLRLLHLVKSRVTLKDKPGKQYVAYMLDLSQYTGERKRRGLDMIEFWKHDGAEKLRKQSLVFSPD